MDSQEKQREIWTVRRFWSLWICPWFYKTLNYLSQINVYWIFNNLISLVWRLLAMTPTTPAELGQQLLPEDLNTHSHTKKQTTRWLKVLLKINNFPKLCFYSLISVKTLQFISFCGASGPRVCGSRLVLSHRPRQEDKLKAVPPSNRCQPRDAASAWMFNICLIYGLLALWKELVRAVGEHFDVTYSHLQQ